MRQLLDFAPGPNKQKDPEKKSTGMTSVSEEAIASTYLEMTIKWEILPR